MRRRKLLLAAALAGLASALPATAAEQGLLTLFVPSAAGSAPDIIARLIGEELRVRLGRTVVIENKPGAGGIVAVMAMRQAARNGDVLLMAQAAVVTVTPLTYRAAKYDMERDFEPVAVVAETPMMFVANPAHGPKSMAELVALGKSKPGTLTMASPARGSIPHLSGELLAQVTGAKFNNVPMGNSGQAVQAVVSGDAPASVDGVAPMLPLIKGGRVRALAVTSTRVLPGLEGFALAKDTVPELSLSGWFMLFAPKGTSAARLTALNSAVNEALKSPEVIQKLQVTANYPVGGSVADARQFLVREKKLWAGAVQRAGLQPE